MFYEIPLKTNLFNFTQGVSIAGENFILKFTYQNRRETYVLDILSGAGNILESGLACALNVQLNRRILSSVRGVLFFQSKDPTISYVDKLNLGTRVKLFFYIPD